MTKHGHGAAYAPSVRRHGNNMKQIPVSIKIKASRVTKWIVICYQIFFILLFLIYYKNPSGASHSAIIISMLSQVPSILIISWFDAYCISLNSAFTYIIIIITQCVILYFIFNFIIQRILLENEENDILENLRRHKS